MSFFKTRTCLFCMGVSNDKIDWKCQNCTPDKVSVFYLEKFEFLFLTAIKALS